MRPESSATRSRKLLAISVAAAGGLVASLLLAAQAGAAPATQQEPDDPPDPAELYAPFIDCPLEEPELWNAEPSGFGTGCFATTTGSGSFTIGDTTVPITNPVTVQFGFYGEGTEGIMVMPPEGAVSAAPETVPGGLLGLMCPSDIPVVSSLCEEATTNPHLAGVTAEVVSAGPITDFDAGAVFDGSPVFTQPVKIELNNVLLGSDCTIGSDEDPILLRPQWDTTDPPPPNEPISGVEGETLGVADPEDPLAAIIQSRDYTFVDNSFDVPEADGCGPLGLADPAVNFQQGLPSEAGHNELVLAETDADLALHNGEPYPARHLAERIADSTE